MAAGWDICHLLVFLHCGHLKLSLTLDFVKVNKRIVDYNNPPWHSMQLSKCLTVACLIEQIKKKIHCVSGMECFSLLSGTGGNIMHRCVELANEQTLFMCL